MARVPCEIRIGTGKNARAVTTEDRYLLGPIEGSWWVKFSWWVIPLGLFTLFLPWFFLFGGGGSSSVQQAPPPVVTYVPPPQQPATYAPAPPPKEPDELSPEELDRRHSEYLRRRSQ